MNEKANARIAKNTLIVYTRIIVTMVVGLVSSRLVLDALGASDFGLYNVVGGIIAMFSIISGAMSTTTTRFLNVEMGLGVKGNMNRVFNLSLILHIFFALLILFLLEVIGVWYVLNILRVDPGKEADAMFVFQVSTVVACLGVLNIPYQSLFIAHERFVSFAIIDILRSILLLVLCFLLRFWPGNGLRFYALCMSGTMFFSFLAYQIAANRRWQSIVSWHPVKEWKAYKDMFIYNNWTLLGTASDVSRNQGSNMLINYFFGTVVNAAFGISYQVMQHISIFVNNFDKAVAPQIVQNMSAGNLDRSIYLAKKTCRMCVLLVEILFFSLYVELDFILRLWLGTNMPEGTTILCRYVLLIALISSTSGGLFQLINGLKDIKEFKILKFIFYLMCLPLGYLAFRMGQPPQTIILFFLLSDIANRTFQFIFLKKKIPIDVISFLKDAYLRPLVVLLLMVVYLWGYRMISIDTSWQRLSGIVLTALLSSVSVFFIGLTKGERKMLFKKTLDTLFKYGKRKV